MYSVEFTPQALDDITRLDKPVAARVVKKIQWLAENFEGIIPLPLKGRLRGVYKLIIGDWRVFYTADTDSKCLTIHLVGHRSEIYKT
jgi:mRNA interferase RelE/StbE